MERKESGMDSEERWLYACATREQVVDDYPPLGELRARASATEATHKRSRMHKKMMFIPYENSSLLTLMPFSLARDLQLLVASAMPLCFDLTESGEKPTFVDTDESGEVSDEEEE